MPVERVVTGIQPRTGEPLAECAERRVELESELDALAAQGYRIVNSFAVDDNVYLVMASD